MNWLNPILLLLFAFVAVFLQSWCELFRNLAGAQFDLLPPLLVYAGLTHSVSLITVLAVSSGLWFDTLSANPFGASVLPLFLVGVLIQRNRAYLLRENVYAQFVLGAGASAASPLLTLFIIFGLGDSPLVGWASLWQWFVVAITGGLAAPLIFLFFDRINRVFNYQPLAESAFRPDREIKRGRT
jgi:rod shape-determining protein MreD